ncbi:MAG TPA: SWIM zinc finger family protein, partial [Isosphaeraceae bacterium]|nr:SWIM zinc finger family protein [Isosphaeraceae bacterium]
MTATTDLALVPDQQTEDVTETEAFKTLVARVGRTTSKIPAECLARHVMQIVPAHEWPVRVEALDALLRRLESARKDELRIEQRPGKGQVLGLYATRRRGSEARPYRTIVLGVDPLQGRCDCPDYLRNSLGLCKHLLAVLDYVHARPGLLKQAQKEQERNAGATFSGPVWDPVRPLLGLGDWLERVSWVGATVNIAKGNGTRAAQALGWFKPGQNGCWS